MLNTFHWKLVLSHTIRILPHFTAFYRIFGRTDLRISVSRAKVDAESDFEVRLAVAPQKPRPIDGKRNFEIEKFRKKNSDVEE